MLALAACGGLFDAGGDLIQAQKVFSMDLFEQNVRDTFTGQSVGFTYAIGQNGTLVRSGEIGFGRTEDEPDEEVNRDIDRDDRMHIATIGKTITPAAVLRLLQDIPGVDLGSSVDPYLPASWVKGPGIGGSAFTFRHLLAHKSGLFYGQVAEGETDDRLAEHIEIGNILPQEPAAYDNVNHALFRVIIPNLLGERHTDSSETEAQFHARVFGEYVQEVVFTPAGVPAERATTVPPGNANRYYPWPYDQQPGDNGTDFSLSYGPYGWYMSVVDLLRVLTYLRFTEDIISNESRTVMNTERLGWWNTRTGANGGIYNMKQGGWRWSSNPTKGMQSVVANFSAGVQAAVIVNSRPEETETFDMASVMRDAFDNAFVSP